MSSCSSCASQYLSLSPSDGGGGWGGCLWGRGIDDGERGGGACGGGVDQMGGRGGDSATLGGEGLRVGCLAGVLAGVGARQANYGLLQQQADVTGKSPFFTVLRWAVLPLHLDPRSFLRGYLLRAPPLCRHRSAQRCSNGSASCDTSFLQLSHCRFHALQGITHGKRAMTNT